LADFDEFAADANYWFVDYHIHLETDVNLAGRTYSLAVIHSFTGVFDGNGHKISNLTIDEGLGLFGRIVDGEVRNLGLEGGTVSGWGEVGGLVGCNGGSVSNCYSTGDVNGKGKFVGGLVGLNERGKGSVSNCYSTGDVNGTGNYVGGLVGLNDAKADVSNCYSTGVVSASIAVGGLVGGNGGSVSNCSSTGDVIGNRGSTGGLVGENNDGSILNCYSTGTVDGVIDVGGLVGWNGSGNVSNCYSTGDVSGDISIGGLVGSNYDSISNCYSTGDANGLKYVGGLVGWNKGSISSCYSTGDVNGLKYVGGLLAYNSDSVSNCFWDTDSQTHGVTESIGDNQGTATNVAGLPTAQMQKKSTFTDAGWDFITPVWTIDEGLDYPQLWWEFEPVLHPEPEITLGTINRISWEPIAGDIEYYAECAEDANFNSIVYNSGWITETNCGFVGLELGKMYWYRVKAGNAADIESKWSNVESSLQGTLTDAVEIELEPESLKNENMKDALLNKIDEVLKMIEEGNYAGALSKLGNDILQKTNGCGETGEPDKNDWIITCEEQSEIYSLVIETIEYVRGLMGVGNKKN
jgi:hypothetical protein